MNLIDFLKPTAEEAIIITNKETIDSFFDSIDLPKNGYAVWNNPEKNKARSIFKDGVTIHFIELQDLEDIKLKK